MVLFATGLTALHASEIILNEIFFFRIYTPFHETSPDTGTKLWMSLANGLILLAVIIVMTVILVLLYKYKWYRVCHTFISLAVISPILVRILTKCPILLKTLEI